MIETTAIEEQWNEFVVSKNEKAYNELYEHYFHYLCFIGLRKGFDAETVKDSINEVFLHCWEKRTKLSHIRNPHNYIVTIFLRKVYREEKKESTIYDFYEEFEESDINQIPLPNVEDSLVNTELARNISRLIKLHLEQLPPRQREIIYQKFYLGLSYHEIAKAGGLSVNTVYNTLYNAVDKLRILLPKNVLFSVIPLFATLIPNIF